MKKLCYLMIFVGSLGISFFEIPLGPIEISNSRLVTLLLLGGIFIWCFLKKEITIFRGGSFYVNELKFMIFWLLYGILNIIFVKDWRNYVLNILALTEGVLFVYICFKILKSEDDIIGAFNAFVCAGIIHNIIGWYEYFTGKYLFVAEEIQYAYLRTKSPVSSFGNCNDFATFLLIITTVSLALFLLEAKRIKKILYSALAISSSILIILTGSRACMLALAVGAITYMIVGAKNIKKITIIKLFFTAIPIMAIILYVFIRKNVHISILTAFLGDGSKSSDSERLLLIKNGLHFVTDTFGLGVGAGNIGYWLSNYAPYKVTVPQMHNWFIEIFSAYGVLIFISYIIFYVGNIKKLLNYSIHISCKKISIIAKCMAVFLISYIIGGISSGSNFLYFWIWSFWALVICCIKIISVSQYSGTYDKK